MRHPLSTPRSSSWHPAHELLSADRAWSASAVRSMPQPLLAMVKFHAWDGQKPLPSVVYGALTTQVPCQAFHDPLSTPPLFGSMFTVTVSVTLVDPHFAILALVVPAYPGP